jgi:hypothetical protein
MHGLHTHYRMSISKIDRDIVGGLIRLHILHHAAEEAIFGLGIIDELTHHGYKLSPGTNGVSHNLTMPIDPKAVSFLA